MKQILIFLVLFGILALGCTSHKAASATSNGNSNADGLSQATATRAANPEKVISEADAKCASLYSKSQCYLQFAVWNRMPEICDKLANDNEINWVLTPRGDCYLKYAEQAEDPTLCTSLKSKFYPTTWDKITDPTQNVEANAYACSLSYTEKPYSIPDAYTERLNAVSKKDPALCDAIKVLDQRSQCLIDIAKVLKDPSYCDKSVIENSYCQWEKSRLCISQKGMAELCKQSLK